MRRTGCAARSLHRTVGRPRYRRRPGDRCGRDPGVRRGPWWQTGLMSRLRVPWPDMPYTRQVADLLVDLPSPVYLLTRSPADHRPLMTRVQRAVIRGTSRGGRGRAPAATPRAVTFGRGGALQVPYSPHNRVSPSRQLSTDTTAPAIPAWASSPSPRLGRDTALQRVHAPTAPVGRRRSGGTR